MVVVGGAASNPGSFDVSLFQYSTVLHYYCQARPGEARPGWVRSGRVFGLRFETNSRRSEGHGAYGAVRAVRAVMAARARQGRGDPVSKVAGELPMDNGQE